MAIKETVCEYVDCISAGSVYSPVVASCDHGNEP